MGEKGGRRPTLGLGGPRKKKQKTKNNKITKNNTSLGDLLWGWDGLGREGLDSQIHCFLFCFFWVSHFPNRFTFFPRASERRVLPIVGVCKTSSHLHIFSFSHLLIFTSSHLHIFLSSHPLIFTSSHLHIFSSSHLLIFTSSHLHIFSSSHLLIFASSHLLIFTSSHLHIFSSSHLLLIFSSSHLLTSSHIFSSLHLLISHLLLLPSCPLLLFHFFLEGGSRGSGNETARNATLSHEMRFDRQKLK